MLSRRIARASALAAARPFPTMQQRTFIPKPVKGRQEELYPDEPTLTDAEDPGMVRVYPSWARMVAELG